MRWAAIAAAVAQCALPSGAAALDLSRNPERSFLVGFSLGAGSDLGREARRSTDGRTVYGETGFLFGLHAAFRFNEVVGVSTGLGQCRHPALEDWGGAAGYTLGDVALRLAIPTPSRQTIVVEVGPAIGEFFYGSVNGAEDSGTLAVGGRGAVELEHELAPGFVAVAGVEYRPLWRRGMGALYLTERDPYEESDPVLVDIVDLGGARLVHLVWVRLALQFEWVIP